jgi:NAD(P)-dependent dehydrogenase (short-subunit alcohol dehydrogenase family)
MQIKNKVALVTGGGHRVGKAISIALAQRKANIAVHYHTSQSFAEDTTQELRNLGVEALCVKGNIAVKDDWLQMKDAILKKWGRIDILINNAAIFYKTPFFNVSEEDLDNFCNTNLKGAFWGCKVVGEIMYKKKTGKIINIADVSAEKIWTNYIPYCISKAAVISLTKGVAKALAPYVTVNAVAPGTVLLAENYDAGEESALIQQTPLKRIGSAEDIANTILFLIEGSNFITGATIKVDGGRSLT